MNNRQARDWTSCAMVRWAEAERDRAADAGPWRGSRLQAGILLVSMEAVQAVWRVDGAEGFCGFMSHPARVLRSGCDDGLLRHSAEEPAHMEASARSSSSCCRIGTASAWFC